MRNRYTHGDESIGVRGVRMLGFLQGLAWTGEPSEAGGFLDWFTYNLPSRIRASENNS